MNKKRIILILGSLIAIIIILFFIDNIQIRFVKVFRLNREIKTFDSKKRMHGKYLKIEKGVVILEGNYLNGSAEGTFKTYYPNGKIKYKAFYKSNKVFGTDYGYYENGNLNYKGYNLNGLYGDSFHYDEDGKMDVYGANDIEHSFFYYSTYKNMITTSVIGTIFSENIYSYDTQAKKTIILSDKAEVKNVVDLFITVAKPPLLSVEVYIEINGRKWSKSNLKSPTVLLKDVFEKQGNYHISINAILKDEKGASFKEDSLKLSIRKI
jgi:hypothetical protein